MEQVNTPEQARAVYDKAKQFVLERLADKFRQAPDSVETSGKAT